MPSTYYLNRDFGYEQYRESGFATGDTIDATDASWIVSNIGDDLNRYPFLIEESGSGLIIKGGTINGEVPLDLDWEEAYVNSSGVLIRDGADVEIRDWNISQAWDAIRLNGDSDGFLIDGVWMTEIRDDAIENDDGSGGTISNSLFDGIFAGISLADEGTPSDAVEQVVKIDGVLMRMESYVYKGTELHFSPLKIEEVSPHVEITNSVFAVESPYHRGLDRQEIGWEKMDVSENNYFLNLSDDPFPDDYPLPGDGWTILEGQEARDYWESAKNDWIETYGDQGHVDDTIETDEEDEPHIEDEPPAPLDDETPDPIDPIENNIPETLTEDDPLVLASGSTDEEGGGIFGKIFKSLMKMLGLGKGKGHKEIHENPEDSEDEPTITLSAVVPFTGIIDETMPNDCDEPQDEEEYFDIMF